MNAPDRVITREQALLSVLHDVMSAELKMPSAPASASAHMDRALFTLKKLCPDWVAMSIEASERMGDAAEHMKLYPHEANAIILEEPPEGHFQIEVRRLRQCIGRSCAAINDPERGARVALDMLNAGLFPGVAAR